MYNLEWHMTYSGEEDLRCKQSDFWDFCHKVGVLKSKKMSDEVHTDHNYRLIMRLFISRNEYKYYSVRTDEKIKPLNQWAETTMAFCLFLNVETVSNVSLSNWWLSDEYKVYDIENRVRKCAVTGLFFHLLCKIWNRKITSHVE